MIEEQINEQRFDFINANDKYFIIAFTQALDNMGYTYGNTIESGFCWGKYMLIFRKANVKSKNVVARIYIKDDCIILRLFFNDVTKHSAFINAAPEHIKHVFLGESGNCKYCKGSNCKFRKDYEINGVQMRKCNGVTFEFHNPVVENLFDYIKLFQEFYPIK